jgi:hypothetical protein
LINKCGARAKKLLAEYEKSRVRATDNVKQLVLMFENSGVRLGTVEKRKVVLQHSRFLLRDFQRRGIDRLVDVFNPLEVLLKRTLDEDDHSDLMVALLDPKQIHGLGNKSLLALLDLAEKREKNPSGICRAIKEKLCESPHRSYYVVTRMRDALSAVDIKVIGDDFVLGIENKRSFGKEHKTDAGWQTQNQWDDLKRWDKEHAALIYIHPMGILPSCKEAIRLDRNDICKWYENISSKIENIELAAFLAFYSRFYLKTI